MVLSSGRSRPSAHRSIATAGASHYILTAALDGGLDVTEDGFDAR
jgi:hypothetical protein